MTNRNIFLLSSFVIAALVFLGACQDEASTTPDADQREALVGEWRCEEDASGISYTVSILIDNGTEDKIVLKNFHGLGTEVSISASLGYGVITLDKSVVDGYTLEGDGNVSDDNKTIAWEYTVDDGNGPETYLSLFTPAGIVVKKLENQTQNQQAI